MILPINQLVDSRYIPTRYIGEGGMAEIYEANDIYCHKNVAIKVIKSELKDDYLELERFKNEARFASMFTNEHIIKIFNIGSYQGHFFISYELMKGSTLKEVLDKRGYLTKSEAIKVILQVLEATSYIHQRKVLHNDIKPENLFMLYDGNIKLLDFGIATHFGEKASKTNASISYAAPEVLRNGFYSVQSDIYSIGVVLFELLTGRVPFIGNTTAVIESHVNEDIPSLNRYSNLTGHQELDKIIKKATNRIINQRYKSDEEMIEDLKQINLDEPEKKTLFQRIFKK